VPESGTDHEGGSSHRFQEMQVLARINGCMNLLANEAIEIVLTLILIEMENPC
jgi:hypothetical protein